MPTLMDVLEATPRCTEMLGPKRQRVCFAMLHSDFGGMDWRCPNHGPVLSWEQAARRVRMAGGCMYFEEVAA